MKRQKIEIGSGSGTALVQNRPSTRPTRVQAPSFATTAAAHLRSFSSKAANFSLARDVAVVAPPLSCCKIAEQSLPPPLLILPVECFANDAGQLNGSGASDKLRAKVVR